MRDVKDRDGGLVGAPVSRCAVTARSLARIRRAALVVGGAALGVVWPSLLISQEAVSEPPRIEEIVVTAEKRETNLQDTPVSISAFTGADLDAAGTLDVEGLAFVVPNFHYGRTIGGPLNGGGISIRGISSAGGDRSLAFHVDGIYVNAAAAPETLTFFDVERVEVLRGPQGTLYGRNATGGAINVISNPPEPELMIAGDVQFGTYDQIRSRAVLNAPFIGDRIFGRLSLVQEDRDGYQRNLLTDRRSHDADDARDFGGRLQFLFDLADHAKLTVRGTYSHRGGVGVANKILGDYPSEIYLDPTADPLDLYGRNMASPNPSDPRKVYADYIGDRDENQWSANAELDWELNDLPLLGNAVLTALFSYGVRDDERSLDSDIADIPLLVIGFDDEVEEIVTEVRLASTGPGDLGWVLGFFFLNSTEDLTIGGRSFPFSMSPPQPGALELTTSQLTDRDARSYAGFGEVSYTVWDEWRFIGGLRYSYDEKKSSFEQPPVFLFPGDELPFIPGTQSEDRDSWDAVTGKVGADWNWRDGSMVYASISRGYKAGIIQTASRLDEDGRPTGDTLPNADPEYIWAYELGSKNQLFDDRLRLNLTGFYYDYDDLQVTTVAENVFVTQNAAAATIWGFEAEVVARPYRETTIIANAAYLNATFDDFVGFREEDRFQTPEDFSGNDLPRAPRYTFNFVGAVRLRLRLVGDGVAARQLLRLGRRLLSRRQRCQRQAGQLHQDRHSSDLAQRGLPLVGAGVRHERHRHRRNPEPDHRQLADRLATHHRARRAQNDWGPGRLPLRRLRRRRAGLLVSRRCGEVSAGGKSSMLKRYSLVSVVVALVIGLGACGSDDDDGNGFAGTIDLEVDRPEICNPVDARHCLLPFPSDFFSVEDASTDSGRRVAIATVATPVNVAGVHVDTTEWNRNDGFSPGAQIATYIEGLDLVASATAPITDIQSSLDDDAPVVLIDADTGERIPHWVEIDDRPDQAIDRATYVRPAVNLLEGHRHLVAFRNLVDGSGNPIFAGDVFRAYRDRLESDVPEVEAQRERYERVFGDLARAGVRRDELYLAWDFTVASTRNLSERVLHMRDDGFARLGDAAPAFEVELVEDDFDDRVARRIRGTFEVPNYMTGSGESGSRINYGPDDLPAANGVFTADFRCVVPRAALSGGAGPAVPARASLYGHGLLGSEGEVSAGNVRSMSNEHNVVFCATKWVGMSEEDVGNAVQILQDFSRFPTLADRTQQGMLNFLFLGRLMIHRDGLSSHPAFQDADGNSVIDRSELYYDGNSQGGIMGGALTAVATDFTRAVLGVPGMNYSVLLQRSVDWDTYERIYNPAYPDQLERGLGLLLAQMLWDRGEANGYAQHITDDPLPGTPPHQVLMHVAFGDHQVAPATAEIEARTIGAAIHWPAVADGRVPDVEAYWGIDRIASYPYDGSAIVIWDSGAPTPPLVNRPPREGDDPHEDPRADPDARVQKSEFLRPDGAVVDVCDGQPCEADRQ